MNDKINAVCRNNFLAYKQIGYSFDDLDNLNNVINRLSQKEEVLFIELHDSMENYARIYNLFRPLTITRDEYYWGTVSVLDSIYSILYRYMGINPTRIFSSVDTNSFKTPYRTRLKPIFNETPISENDLIDLMLNQVSLKIKKAIGQKAVELFVILGNNDKYYFEKEIELYVKTLLDSDFIDIKVINGSDNLIKVNNKIIQVESELAFRTEILNMTSDVINEKK